MSDALAAQVERLEQRAEQQYAETRQVKADVDGDRLAILHAVGQVAKQVADVKQAVGEVRVLVDRNTKLIEALCEHLKVAA